MKKPIFYSMLSVALAFTTVGCDVDQTREGELPNVDVNVDADPGQMPAFDVDGPDVNVTTEERQVKVPDVDVNMEEKTITMPNVDVDLPADE